MANGVNKVILVGNLGKDPEIQSFDNGVKKAAFSLATTEGYKNREGERTTHTEWHNIIVWRGLAEIAEKYLRKGSSIYLEGKIRRREYEDENKQKRYMYEILGDSFTMLGGGPRREGTAEENGATPVPATEPLPNAATPEDDLPF